MVNQQSTIEHEYSSKARCRSAGRAVAANVKLFGGGSPHSGLKQRDRSYSFSQHDINERMLIAIDTKAQEMPEMSSQEIGNETIQWL